MCKQLSFFLGVTPFLLNKKITNAIMIELNIKIGCVFQFMMISVDQ